MAIMTYIRTDTPRRRRASVSFLLIPALLSLASTGETSAFLHAPKRRQLRHTSSSSTASTTTSLFYSSSIFLRSESELSNINDGSSSSVSSVTLRSDSTTKPQQQHRRRHDHSKHKHSDNPNNDWLIGLGLPRGLRDTLLDNIQEVSSKRIWIIDNSGSMKMLDGHEILASSSSISSSNQISNQSNNNNEQVKVVPVIAAAAAKSNTNTDSTRWAEVQETVICHAQFLSVLGAPTDFRLLNPPSNGGPQKFRVGYNNNNNSNNKIKNIAVLPSMNIFRRRQSDSHRAEKIMNRNKPKGKTPLHEAVLDVRKEVIRTLPQLRADGMKVTIVICTDGCTSASTTDSGEASPSPQPNQELEDALESLRGLPVCVIIRLCTDYGHVVDFYNGLDERMGGDGETGGFLDVLNDYEAEAAQVHGQNPWLNYALILHRMREMGLQGSSGLLDSLDQRPFSGDEIRSFVALLFGTTSDLLPDPLCDWENFVSEIDRLQQREQMHWNPAKRAVTPWIDIEELLAMK